MTFMFLTTAVYLNSTKVNLTSKTKLCQTYYSQASLARRQKNGV